MTTKRDIIAVAIFLGVIAAAVLKDFVVHCWEERQEKPARGFDVILPSSTVHPSSPAPDDPPQTE